jgi:hypothetical protein
MLTRDRARLGPPRRLLRLVRLERNPPRFADRAQPGGEGRRGLT